ncbi:cysteinyl-trna synthetase [Lasallia pustulata]|uniref:cysteine--tRNA ligase n=1 Tax=Lasallia pustulata TaxID=136370 RepID=A0A1W5CRP8_9LECA|nr:cysteinyl-trna synthetase [Lasallia pustulata]
MAALARQQPLWQPPPEPGPEAQLPPLKIYNSLTRSKTPFVPLDWKNKNVSWYACGPTVYDDAHLGHARNYMSTDIIRRILRDFFRYKVNFVMNITDVDDKIIVRGRQQHLLAEFIAKHSFADPRILDTSLKALKAYLAKNLPQTSPETVPQKVQSEVNTAYAAVLRGGSLMGGPPGDKEAKIKMHIKTVLAASESISSLQDASVSEEDFFTNTQDILLPYLDSLHGSSINADDHTIFTKLTKKFEERFMHDLRDLNCLDPDQVTRVTEFGQQIVDFVEKIEKNGFAYTTSDGSVYFDISAFEKANNSYARLEPWNRNDTELQADGEGALTKKSSEKRSDADFALWKSSKPGEPSWSSPWGKGRPGWHIECSAMASDRLGSQLDIHSGGIDLAFPHHDNELAQSEAYWLDKGHEHQHQWVNYFMHMGHLSIQGSKMSKSLKNFTTIREALNRGDWTPRSLRILFLLGGWKEGVEITDDLVKSGNAWEDKMNNFFIKAKDVLGDQPNIDSSSSSHTDVDGTLEAALKKASKETYGALCDSFNTPSVMNTMSELVTAYNIADKAQISQQTTLDMARWTTSMVNTFGLNGTAGPDDSSIGWSGIDIPEEAKPYLYPLSSMRDELRQKAKSTKGITREAIQDISGRSAPVSNRQQGSTKPYATVLSTFHSNISSLSDSATLSKDVLQLCDRLRDVDLWDLGIYLEDRDGDQPALVRPVTKELRALRQEKEDRDRQKLEAKEERGREAAQKAEKGQLSHLDMFRTSEYSAWDEEGLPLRDKEGKEVAKSRGKKLRKEWERQRRVHEAWVKGREG